MNTAFRHNLVGRFMLIGLLVLVAGMALIGIWVGTQIKRGVVNGSGVVTNFYVDGAISPHLQSLRARDRLEDADRLALNRLLTSSHLGENIVALKVWGRNGRVIYNSPDPSVVGRRYAMERPIAQAFGGEIQSRIVDRGELPKRIQDGGRSRLIETFAPIRAEADGSILAVAGFYQPAERLEQGVLAAQYRSWGVHGAVTLVILILLATLVRKANGIIEGQQTELNDKVAQLTALLAQNEQLHERVSRAAARATSLNERFLRSVAADLHDGPGQCLALASMRFVALAEVCGRCDHSAGKENRIAEDFSTVQVALQSGLSELRAILRGLQLPEIEQLSLPDTIRRVVNDHERKTGISAPITASDVPDRAPLPVRIAAYRLVQESLANGYRHGGGRNQRVSIAGSDNDLRIEVADDGKGFDPAAPSARGRFGIDGMRERIQLLGGNFEVHSMPGQGTVIRATLPMSPFREVDG